MAKDNTEAVKWIRKAAEQNLAVAQSNLGDHYEKGVGVVKDLVEAYRWHTLAAGQGILIVKKHIAVLESSLTPEQIAEGKRRADDWRKQHNF